MKTPGRLFQTPGLQHVLVAFSGALADEMPKRHRRQEARACRGRGQLALLPADLIVTEGEDTSIRGRKDAKP